MSVSQIKNKILAGKLLAKRVELVLARQVEELARVGKRAPGLAVILVGDNPASHAYVKNKAKSAARCGFIEQTIKLPASASDRELSGLIAKLNHDPLVDGILLQLPLPKPLQGEVFVEQIDPSKDVDGLHSVNLGRVMQGRKGVRSCTPLGAMMLADLAFSEIDLSAQEGSLTLPKLCDFSGKEAVVVGRSILVGKPLSMLLLERNATVTIAHSRTPDLPAVARRADLLFAAVGVPKLVKGDWIKPGAVAIDVGINRLPDGSLCGDIDFESANSVAGAITPVPGGVGPMTVAMLMQNTLSLYRANIGIND